MSDTPKAANEEAAKKFRAEHANDIEGTREALERCANMLNTYAPDLYPAGENGQVSFARAMMESVADEINAFLRATPEDARDRVIREQAKEIAMLRARDAAAAPDQSPSRAATA